MVVRWSLSSASLNPSELPSIRVATSFAPQSKTFPARSPSTRFSHWSSSEDNASIVSNRFDNSFRACSFSCCFCWQQNNNASTFTHPLTKFSNSEIIWGEESSAYWTDRQIEPIGHPKQPCKNYDWQTGFLVTWLAGWFVTWLAGWLTSRLIGRENINSCSCGSC